MYYHLEEYNDAVNYALESGEYFDLNQRSQYIDTLIGKCIDRYVSERQRNADSREGAERVEINKKLEEIIEKIFQKSISEREYRLGLGVALDARRLDKVAYYIPISSLTNIFLRSKKSSREMDTHLIYLAISPRLL